jgi:dihydroorotase
LCEFELAAFGITGFETAFGALMTLVHNGSISLNTMLACLTSGPAAILRHLNRKIGTLNASSVADITLLDLDREWTVNSKTMLSKGKNTPYNGQTFKGTVVATIYHGSIAYNDNTLRKSK